MSFGRTILSIFLLSGIVFTDAAIAQTRTTTRHGDAVLVFTKTAGFRHTNIPKAVEAIKKLGEKKHFTVEWTEDGDRFTHESLVEFGAVVFLNTTGDILSPDQQAAFERYMEQGGGFVGIHSAADTEYDWEWYGALVGAYFVDHSEVQAATVLVADGAHPSTNHLPKRWVRTDEWYNYTRNPRGRVHILAAVDEASYTGGSHGHDHPISWCHDYQGGRSWYTGLGHTEEAFSDQAFLDHLYGGLEYATGSVSAECGATIDANYEKVVLETNTENPMELSVAPDGRVFFVELYGKIKLYDPAQDQTRVIGELNVFHQFEDGLAGITLDPEFERNGWIYLFYSPAGERAIQRVSRFAFDGSKLDINSENVLLEIPTQREQCCHTSGSLTFGADGNLFISTGDNSNPFESDGYSPIDEREGRSPWDAQKSSGNTNDLRGKILRIRPKTDGTYSIPEGNLFAEGDPLARPEIYVMGVRNPFRISIDPTNGWLYWGDVGPDAGLNSPERGPRGYDEWNQARSAGNFGWPYCSGDNRAYHDYDFADGSSGPAFDCGAPVNQSPNNTGRTELPPAREALIWYPYHPSSVFPEIDGEGAGRTAAAGPVYRYDAAATSNPKLPKYFDRSLFIYEWSRNWIKEVKFDESGAILDILPVLSGIDLTSPIDMELGPDGALYLLEWGSNKFGRNNTDAQLSRIRFRRGNKRPAAIARAEPAVGPVPLTVSFEGRSSFDPDSYDDLEFFWSFDGDSTVDSREVDPIHTFTTPGEYDATLMVKDRNGGEGTASVRIVAGNSRPEMTILDPPDGGFFDWGETVPFRITVHDHEDGSTHDDGIPCSAVSVQPALGHDSHSHGDRSESGCTGTFTTSSNSGHDAANLFYVVEASYEDEGAPNVSSLRGFTVHVLHPKTMEAEHLSTTSDVAFVDTEDPEGGGKDVVGIRDGDFLSLEPVNLRNIHSLSYRVHPLVVGTRIEVRVDSITGPVISSTEITGAASATGYLDVSAPIEGPAGSHALYILFSNATQSDDLLKLNRVHFRGEGIALPKTPESEGTLAAHSLFPNPTDAGSRFTFSLTEPAIVQIELFGVLGRRIATLVDALKPVGVHTIPIPTEHLASGLYILRLHANDQTISRNLVIAR